MDKVTLKSLRFMARHGYYTFEQEEGNQFEVDVTAWGDFKSAIEEDDLNKTFDYEQVQEIAGDIFYGRSERLIETLCHNIGEAIFARFKHLKQLEVSIRKINPPIINQAAYAEITMQWKR